MLRIRFTVTGLSRSRMVAGLGPLMEGAFALKAFGNGANVPIKGWRNHVRKELGERIFEVELINRQYRSITDLLDLLAHPAPARDLDRYERVMGVLADFCQVAVLPYWDRIRNRLKAVCDAQGQVAIASGFERMLSTLHPQLRWRSPVLQMPYPVDEEVRLGENGLVLSPSFFLYDQSCVFVPSTRDTGVPAVAFPVNEAMKVQLWESEESNEQALGALIGHTRAAALQELAAGCTTGELAERLGISMAGASKHAAVLRKSGLITTARNRNTALHTLTPLGMALLRNHSLGLQGGHTLGLQSVHGPRQTRVSA